MGWFTDLFKSKRQIQSEQMMSSIEEVNNVIKQMERVDIDDLFHFKNLVRSNVINGKYYSLLGSFSLSSPIEVNAVGAVIDMGLAEITSENETVLIVNGNSCVILTPKLVSPKHKVMVSRNPEDNPLILIGEEASYNLYIIEPGSIIN